MDERRRERKLLRREIGSYSWALLVYYLIMNVAVTAVDTFALMYEGVQMAIRTGDIDAFESVVMERMKSILMGNGWGYLAACGIAVLMILGWKGKEFFGDMFQSRRGMSGKSFFSLLCLFLSGQMLSQVLADVLEYLLNLVGLSIMESMKMASAGADTFSMFLYMGIAAPIVEEIVFRGLIMRGLQPYGKRFAVLASAILFGLFHGNLVQSPYAFVVGLVLGYTAMEYSILWAMVLHMMNNLVLGDTLPRLFPGFSEYEQGLFIWVLLFVFAVASLIILICRRQEIREYNQADPMDRRCLRGFFTAVPNILLLILMSLNAVSMLFL